MVSLQCCMSCSKEARKWNPWLEKNNSWTVNLLQMETKKSRSRCAKKQRRMMRRWEESKDKGWVGGGAIGHRFSHQKYLSNNKQREHRTELLKCLKNRSTIRTVVKPDGRLDRALEVGDMKKCWHLDGDLRWQFWNLMLFLYLHETNTIFGSFFFILSSCCFFGPYLK